MTARLFDCRIEPQKVDPVLRPILEAGALASGTATAELEDAIGRFVDGRSVVAVSDLTHALFLALVVAGVGKGDEVITLAFNCMSSNSAIAMIGAIPVWVDLDPETVTVDLHDLAGCISSKTKAVIVYHVAGHVSNLDALTNLCSAAGIPLIEDANTAFGALWQGRSAGTFGDFGVYSFYANRQVNGIEGAAVVCGADHAGRMRSLRRFGIRMEKFRTSDGEIDPLLDIPEVGYSASMTNVNAALALYSLRDFNERFNRVRANAASLTAALTHVDGVQLIKEIEGAQGAFWVYLLRSECRDQIMSALKREGVDCSRLHQRNDRYSGFNTTSRTLPGTGQLEKDLFALPVGWWLNSETIDRIAKIVASV